MCCLIGHQLTVSIKRDLYLYNERSTLLAILINNDYNLKLNYLIILIQKYYINIICIEK